VSIFAQLGISGPVPLILNAPALPDLAQQRFWSVRKLVRIRWGVTPSFPFRVVVVVIISTIQELPWPVDPRAWCARAASRDSLQ
jgi:hypothetical protein